MKTLRLPLMFDISNEFVELTVNDIKRLLNE